ncbi:hypothetical protein [Mucilaginibacter sp. 10B2]|uniref:hypothetical protein n=1 Tax=Mucilaginibacter sp. 10B2 TaxID=3048574 RepID=UPI002B23E355|nr:hypothetical protein [Mucilaginibacter sp. 10B2]MEB0280529.1 hypothetical protein [Mucilaginibacter sp. 10B2]
MAGNRDKYVLLFQASMLWVSIELLQSRTKLNTDLYEYFMRNIFFQTLMAIILLSRLCIAQSSRPVNQREISSVSSLKRSEMVNYEFYYNFSYLSYDSIKIYSFNKEKYIVNEHSLKVDTPNVYNVIVVPDTSFLSVDGSRTDDLGKSLSTKDAWKFVNGILRSNQDRFPYVGFIDEYIPTIGFVFFRNKKPVAHIDVALHDDKIRIEILKNNNKVFRYQRDVIGKRTKKLIVKLARKYGLPEWVFSGVETKFEK